MAATLELHMACLDSTTQRRSTMPTQWVWPSQVKSWLQAERLQDHRLVLDALIL
jgi:hypothetical protein